MLSTDFLAIFVVFVFTAASSAALYVGVERTFRPMQRRLRDLGVRIKVSEGTYQRPEEVGVAEIVSWLEKRLPDPQFGKPAVEKLAQTLQYAGFSSPNAVKLFTMIRLGVTAAAASLAYGFTVVTAQAGLGVMIWTGTSGCLGYLAPLYYVRTLARSRQVRIRRELPDVIDLLVVCLECGLGIGAAIRMVGSEFQRQGRMLGAQLTTLGAELGTGRPLGEGLRSMAARTGVEEIRSVSAIVSQSEKLGSEMAEALRATSGQLRAQRSARAEEKAQKLPVKMIIPLIGFLLPAMMLIVVGPMMIQLFRTFTNFHPGN